MNWTCNVSLYNDFVLVVRFELYMFWSDLNYICIYIYVSVRFEFFLAGKCTVRMVLD
jgi:hypothetical protein